MLCGGVLQRGHCGNGCEMASTLCRYDLRTGDVFVLSWAWVQQVRRGSISSDLLLGGGGVRSILLLPLVARCIETIDVCIWHIIQSLSHDCIIGSYECLLLFSPCCCFIIYTCFLCVY